MLKILPRREGRRYQQRFSNHTALEILMTITHSGKLKSIILLGRTLWNRFRSWAACSIISVCRSFRADQVSRQSLYLPIKRVNSGGAVESEELENLYKAKESGRTARVMKNPRCKEIQRRATRRPYFGGNRNLSEEQRGKTDSKKFVDRFRVGLPRRGSVV